MTEKSLLKDLPRGEGGPSNTIIAGEGVPFLFLFDRSASEQDVAVSELLSSFFLIIPTCH